MSLYTQTEVNTLLVEVMEDVVAEFERAEAEADREMFFSFLTLGAWVVGSAIVICTIVTVLAW